MALSPRSVLTSDGLRLFLYDHRPTSAEGPLRGLACLLVHGFAQNRLAFTEGPIPGLLAARGARVFVAELRGHGASEPPRRGQAGGLGAYLELDLPPLLARVRAEAPGCRLVFIGHSMGGHLGYASLACPDPPDALVTLGSPVLLGHGRPLVRAIARAVRPTLAATLRRTGPGRLPIDRLLRSTRLVTTLAPRGGPLRSLRELARLANPREADRERIHTVLGASDPADARVLLEMAALTAGDTPRVGSVALLPALAASPVPVLAVVAGRDLFGSAEAFAPITEGRPPGLRRLLLLEHAGHVDLTLGHSSIRIVDALAALVRATNDA